MRLDNVAVPLGLGWSSPFTRWQGPLAELSSVDLAVDVTGRALSARGFDVGEVTHAVLGTTVPQESGFYGVTSVAPRLGMPAVTGPVVAQACATSAAVLAGAAVQVQLGAHRTVLAVAADRTSNGPLMVYPSPVRSGGAPRTEHWVLDPMGLDPTTGDSMLATAENVAADEGFTRQELDEVTLLRHEQYVSAVDRGVQRGYLVEAHVPGRKGHAVVAEDFGVHAASREGLAKLAPVRPGGVVTFGSQTHPGDGTAGVVLSTVESARAFGGGVARILAVSFARVELGRMPKAPVPAARSALGDAGLGIGDIDVVTTHNPFAVNDLYFHRETGFALEKMNPYGSSLVYGHPQGPTGLRAVVELIEALRARGGGRGLFTGCAAGDTAGAVVVEVDDR